MYASHRELTHKIEVRGQRYNRESEPLDRVCRDLIDDVNLMLDARIPEEGRNAAELPNIPQATRFASSIGTLVPLGNVLPPRPPLLYDRRAVQLANLEMAVGPNRAVPANREYPLAVAVPVRPRTRSRSRSRSRGRSGRTGRI